MDANSFADGECLIDGLFSHNLAVAARNSNANKEFPIEKTKEPYMKGPLLIVKQCEG